MAVAPALTVRGRAGDALAVPLAAWALSRALVLVLGVLGSLLLGAPERGVDPGVPDAVALLAGWDSSWYLDIARYGYEPDVGQVGEVFTNLAFWPLLPAILALALAAGLNAALVGIALANVVFLGALWGLHGITAVHLGPALAARATWVLALAPPAIAASLVYTEALALGLSIVAALAATRGRFAVAGLAAAAAALSRPPGAAAAILVAMLALQAPRPARAARLVQSLAPTAAALLVLFGWFAVRDGAPTLPLDAQGAWDRGAVGIGLATHAPGALTAAVEALVGLDWEAQWTAVIRDVAFGALYVALLVRLWRREGGLRSPWVAYSALVLALPLSSGSVDSLARLGLLAFPLAWPAAELLERQRDRRAVLIAALALIVLGVAQLRIVAP